MHLFVVHILSLRMIASYLQTAVEFLTISLIFPGLSILKIHEIWAHMQCILEIVNAAILLLIYVCHMDCKYSMIHKETLRIACEPCLCTGWTQRSNQLCFIQSLSTRERTGVAQLRNETMRWSKYSKN